MRAIRTKRPSLGTILGLTALVVAVVGSASAAPSRVIIRKGDLAKGAVTARAIAKGAVKAQALGKGAITPNALAKGAVATSALAPDAVNAGALAPGSVYGGALGGVVVHRQSIADIDGPPEISNWTPSPIVVAKCDPGERLLTGGVVISDPGNGRVAIVQNAPTEDGWVGQISSDASGAAKAEVQAVCLK